MAAVSADRTQPAMTADRSRSISTAFTNNGTSTIAITSAAPTTKLTISATRTFRPRNSDVSTSVNRPARRRRRWCTMKPIPATRASGYNQPQVGAAVAGEFVEPLHALDLGRSEQGEVERDERGRQESGTDPVDARRSVGSVVLGERPPHRGCSDDRQGHVEPELPPPRQEPHEHRAVQRPPHPAERFDGAEGAERPRSPLDRVHVADDGQRDRHHRTATDRGRARGRRATFRASRTVGSRSCRRRRSQYASRNVRRRPMTSLTRPGDRHHRDERDQVRVDDPGGVVEPVGQDQSEVADDRPQHGRHDGEVVGGDEHAEADRPEDRPWRGGPVAVGDATAFSRSRCRPGAGCRSPRRTR